MHRWSAPVVWTQRRAEAVLPCACCVLVVDTHDIVRNADAAQMWLPIISPILKHASTTPMAPYCCASTLLQHNCRYSAVPTPLAAAPPAGPALTSTPAPSGRSPSGPTLLQCAASSMCPMATLTRLMAATALKPSLPAQLCMLLRGCLAFVQCLLLQLSTTFYQEGGMYKEVDRNRSHAV
jgi:hypothetical protein